MNENIYDKLVNRKLEFKEIELPVYDEQNNSIGKVALIEQRAEQDKICKEKALNKLNKILELNPYLSEARTKELYNDYCAEEILFEVMRYPDDLGKKIFPDKNIILKQFTSNQLGIILNWYNLFQAEKYVITEMSEEQIKTLIYQIQTGALSSENFLVHASSAIVLMVVEHLISRLSLENP